MTEKQAFGVVVRAIGVFVLLDGARQFWLCFARLFWTGHYLYSNLQNFLYTIAVLALGNWMIRRADQVVQYA